MTKINLFCLPFAGGSKYSYRGYTEIAPQFLNIIPIEIPGRGSRFKENLLTDIDKMVDDVFNQISDRLSHPYAIYGHSMGSLIGYLLTKKIIKENLNQPLHLFFTGCVGPSVRNKETKRHLLPKDQFLQKIKELGGSPDEILNEPELMGFFEPILRADFQAVETYEYEEPIAFNIPIDIVIGIEERATYEGALAWQKETTYPVEIRQFPGKHFFIFEYEHEIIKIISSKLNSIIIQQ
jgi:surfactin synthase thioesterase subunit